MEKLLSQIAAANEEETALLLDAVLARYAVLYPDWEISTLSLPKNPDRVRHLEGIIQTLEQMKRRESQA